MSHDYMDFDQLKTKVRKSRKDRDWDKVESPKDLAIAVSVEASELLENFHLMSDSEVQSIKGNEDVKLRIKDELENVISNCRKMANALGIELD